MKDNCTILFGKQSSAIRTGALHDARVDGWREGREQLCKEVELVGYTT